jgi:tetratricopeptide (TPR) repeat protein
MDRLEILQSLVDQNPTDAFRRYGLALELKNAGRLEDAVGQFVVLLDHNPGYSAGYFQAAQTLEKLGRTDDARGLYRRGIEAASAAGDDHAAMEMQAALDLLR